MADHRLASAAAARALTGAAVTATSDPAQRLGVLLIEDDDDDALIVEHLLEDTGTATVVARGRTLAEGLRCLSADVGCVLLDLHLPDASGVEGVRRLRTEAPGGAVIVLTGLDDAAAGEAAMGAGAQDYLVKGRVDAALLGRAIRYAIGRRQAEDALAQLRIAEVRADENARLERGLVPHPIVSSPSVWIASRYLPGRRRALIGGDFYDAIEVAGGAVHVVIGDVSGRGPDEAALGAALRIAWRALTFAGASPDAVLPTLQSLIEAERQDAGTFATLCTVAIDPGAGSLALRRAGHPAPMLVSDQTVRSLPLDGGGPPIGMFSAAEWPASEFALPDRWALLLYTDGLIEGQDGAGGLLGEDGLRELVAARLADAPRWRADPGALLGEIVQETRRRHGGPSADDVALLGIGGTSD